MSDKYNDKNIKNMLEEKKVPQELCPESVKKMLDKFGHENRRKNKLKFNILKIGSIAAALALVIGITANAYIKNNHKCTDDLISQNIIYKNDQNVSNMKYAKSYDDIYNYFKLSKQISKSNDTDDMDMGMPENGAEFADEAYGDGSSSNANAKHYNNQNDDFTNTYNQESGVLEADKVKTDGKTIFYVSGNEIRAAQVDKGKFTKVRTFADNLGYIYDMYLYDNKLVVISDNITQLNNEDTLDGCCYNYEENNTLITIYSKNDYSLIGQYQQEGRYTDVRLREDGNMYLISDDTKDNYDLEFSVEDTERYVPSYLINNESKELECSDILISDISPDDSSSWISYINISSFNLNSEYPYEPTDVKSIAGNAGTIYCSMNNLYITFGYDNTEITRFAIEDGKITPEAGTSVKGIVNDQFSMSEYNGYFRIATTFDTLDFLGLNDINTNNCLYVLDMNLNEVGSISDFGLDETIKSVNYNGDMAYIVTFRQTDPLYAIDLSDPANPKKTDELKITGYSSYMQKWSDGMLLGFGESGDEEGNLNGLKLSMFDNSDPNNLKIIDSIEINSLTDTQKSAYSYSYALYDRKALLISPKKNIIGIPVNIDSIYTNSYSGVSSYKFYSFENNRFTELGELKMDISEGYYSEGFQRVIIINDYIYVLSDVIFMSADINNFEQIDSFTFPIKTESNAIYKETSEKVIVD